LEIGAFYSLKVRDVSAFARYEAMLSGYYRDFKWVEPSLCLCSITEYSIANQVVNLFRRSVLPPSTSQPPLLGLSLLSLLASSRIADFHTVLETLDEQMMNDVYVRWPIDL
jgi:26S proteasome regulatory subunit N12